MTGIALRRKEAQKPDIASYLWVKKNPNESAKRVRKSNFDKSRPGKTNMDKKLQEI